MVDQEDEKGRGAGEDPSHDHDADCTDAVARLYEFLDGELDGATMTLVREHLEHCSPCLEAFDFHAELRAVVKEKCAEPMPADVRQKLLVLLDQSGPGCTPG